MKKQSKCLSAIMVLFVPMLSFAGQSASGGAEADILWAQIKGLVEEHRQAREKARALPPAKAYQVRERALEFYETYPDDSRSAALRRAFLSIKYTDPFDPFSSAVSRVQMHEKRAAGGYWDLDARTEALLKIAADAQVDEGKVSNEFHLLRNIVNGAHPTVDEQRAIYARLQASPNETLRALAAGRERFLALSDQPLELRLPTAEGGVMDLKELRGKVVLLDVWSMGCSSCIEAMPQMQTLYEKYRDCGFEVVGVFLTTQDSPEKQAAEQARGLEIMHQQGATWSDAVMAGQDTVQAFMRRYSLRGVPQLWLLDQTGRLALEVNLGRDFHGPRAGEARLEREIERLLGN
ncbi:MAG: TlpA disulfide reductase family protein [Candidatus Didemnitutus sp.]|nr:TlpA disulfide reductase family protein [Candidatus Didemnitutus sp.]